PNLPEACRLAGLAGAPADEAARRRLALELARRGPAVLLKGGHAAGAEVVDLLALGGEVRRFARPRIASSSTHGTGCTLAAAIAARLARGDAVAAAVGGAVDYLHGAIRHAPGIGGGHGPVGHFWQCTEGERGTSRAG
ncbi:MAG: bifunctional hydroxymethylpyrimidine kinase/phosphomethylpyrimidine kinase, partial [Acidobacteria bacterium]